MGALWYISGPYLARRWKTVIIASFLSSVIGFFICYTSYNSCLNLLSYQDWALFGTLLVISCNVLDHLDALLNTYPHLAVGNDIQKKTKIQSPTSISYWMAIATLILNMPSETDLHPGPIQDLQTAIKVLGPASRSWKTMAALFPTNLRQDLCLLYAFFRTADDLVDDAPTPAQCKENLVIIRRFLREVFIKKGDPKDNRQSENSPSRDLTLPNHVNWNYYAQVLPTSDVIAVFRNFARISHYLCPRAMSELTDAWEHDLKGEPVKRQEDLLHYAALISGTFGELCTCVIMYKTGHGNWNGHDKISRDEEVLSRARATGQVKYLLLSILKSC
jgi:hypothetical protein